MDIFKIIQLDIKWISKIQFIYPIKLKKNVYCKTKMKKIKQMSQIIDIANPHIITSHSSLVGRSSLASHLFSFLFSLSLRKKNKQRQTWNSDLSFLTFVYVTQISLFFFTCTPRILFDSQPLIYSNNILCFFFFFLKKKKNSQQLFRDIYIYIYLPYFPLFIYSVNLWGFYYQFLFFLLSLRFSYFPAALTMSHL